MTLVTKTEVRDWKELFLESLPLIEKVIAYTCRRHCCRPEEAQEFAAWVKFKIVADGYAVFDKFRGRSSWATYLTVVVQHLFLDHRQRLWGRWRPSTVAGRLGPEAALLEQLLVRDGYTFMEACEILKTNLRLKISMEKLNEMAGQLPGRVRRSWEGEELLSDLAAASQGPDERLLEMERRAVWRKIESDLCRALSALPSEDRLILRMRFEDGLTLAEVAKILHLEQKGLYRRMERILKELRRSLEEKGIRREEVTEILGSRLDHSVERTTWAASPQTSPFPSGG